MNNKTSKLVNTRQTAQILGVSLATVNNWVKADLLVKHYQGRLVFYEHNQVIALSQKLKSGKLSRLNSRANKSRVGKVNIPRECLENKQMFIFIQQLTSLFGDNNWLVEDLLLVLTLRLLRQNRLLDYKLGKSQLELICLNQNLKVFIEQWYKTTGDISDIEKELASLELPSGFDLLGILYQSISSGGKRSKAGSFYTPLWLIEKMVTSHLKDWQKGQLIIDPCCGSGSFIVASGRFLKEKYGLKAGQYLYGFENDPMAAIIAKVNLYLLFGADHCFSPFIFVIDSLDIPSWPPQVRQLLAKFDYVFTNPPWGAIVRQKAYKYKQLFGINSEESFALFVALGFRLLKQGGQLSYVLPESILNIQMHAHIRKLILEFASIRLIEHLGRVFQGVLANTIRLDLQKGLSPAVHWLVSTENGCSKKILQQQFIKNRDYVFSSGVDQKDQKIIDLIYNHPHITLKNNASWALGIVTGDNQRFLSSVKKDDFEEIVRGSDIFPYQIKSASSFIRFQPHLFQQVTHERKYRTKPKLVYRFISQKLVFALDTEGRLTLNSANIVIPQIDGYPIKLILALFNSQLYQYLFQKQYSALKILRSHLEVLPLPLWSLAQVNEILQLVNRLSEANVSDKLTLQNKINLLIGDYFGLNCEQKQLIATSCHI